MSIIPGSRRFDSVAEIIALNCRSVYNVQFNSFLFNKISQKIKLKCDEKLRTRIMYLWNNKDGHLRSAVSKLLNEEQSKKKDADMNKDRDFSKKEKPSYSDVLKRKVEKQVENPTFFAEKKFLAVSKLLHELESNKKDENVKTDCDYSKKTPIFSDLVKIDEKVIEEKIVAFGNDKYMIRDVRGDGNCLFRSFSLSLYGHEESHFDIRLRIVEFAVKNWSTEKDLIISCHNRTYKDMTEYESVMRKNSEFGTDYELSAFIRLYKVMVTLFKYEHGTLKFSGTFGEDTTSTVTLMFTGDRESGHWLVLKPILNKTNESTVDEAENMGDTDKTFIEEIATDEKSDRNESDVFDQNITKNESNTPKNITTKDESVTTLVENIYNTNEVSELATSMCNSEDNSSVSSTSLEIATILSHVTNHDSTDKANIEQHRTFDFEKSYNYINHDMETECCSESSNVELNKRCFEQHNVSVGTKFDKNVLQTLSLLQDDGQLNNEKNAPNEVSVDQKSIEYALVTTENVKQASKLIEKHARLSNTEATYDHFQFKSEDDVNCETTNTNEVDDMRKLYKFEKSKSKKFFKSKRDSKTVQYKLQFHESNNEDGNSSKYRNTMKVAKLNKENSESSSESDKSVMSDEEDMQSLKTKKVEKYNVDIGEYEINPIEFKNSYGCINYSKVRDFIKNFVLDELLCTCSLRFIGSIRRNREEIVAYAKCRRVNHKQSFRFYLSQLGDEDPLTKLTISSTNQLKFVHDESDGPMVYEALRGEERKGVQKELKHQRVCTYVDEQKMNTNVELFKDGHPGKLRKYNTYCKIKSEENCAERLKLESLDLADLNQLWIEHQKKSDPFLRKTGNPLTAIMYREAELNIAIDEKPVVLHMDATGSYARKPYNVPCKQIYYYVILFKGKTDIVKIAHMITCNHTVSSVREFLKDYRYFVEEKINVWPIADIITIDWSWVLMHAVSREWNDMSIIKYLKIMYKYCKKNTSPGKKLILIKLCYAHFMHMVSTTIKKKFPEYKECKGLLLECMALLCLSRDLSETDMLFKNIIKLLCTRNLEKVKEYMAVLINHKSKHPAEMKVLDEVDKLADDQMVFDEENSDTIYRQSPFFHRYEFIAYETLKGVNEQEDVDTDTDKDSDEESTKNKITNKYYAPKFIDHLRTKWMPYVVMWSALDIQLIGSNISRVSNAYVESSNRTTKEIDFGGNSQKSVGDRVRQLENRTKSTVASELLDAQIKPKAVQQKQNYPTIEESDNEQQLSKQPRAEKRKNKKKKDFKIDKTERKTVNEYCNIQRKAKTEPKKRTKIQKFPETEPNPVSEEKWNPKKKGRKGRGHVKKGNLNKLMRALMDADYEWDRKEWLEKNSKQNLTPRISQKENEKHVTNETVFVEKNNNKRKREELGDMNAENGSAKHDETESEGPTNTKRKCSQIVNEIQETNTIADLKTFCNGLIHDVNYYLLSKSSTPTVGRYTMRHSASIETFQLFAREFSTLRNKIWIDGIVLDSFVATQIDEWIDTTYVPTDDSITIVGDYSHERVNKNKFISKTTKRLKNNILLPYLYCAHWRLLYVKIKEKKIMLLDPYGTDSDKNRAVEAFKNFTEYCAPNSSFSTLRNIQWEMEEVLNRPYQQYDDGYSCGSYVMHYLQCLGSGKPFNMDFNPSIFREEVAYKLLLNSENMENICLNCCATTNTEKYKKCTMCKRKCHETCIIKAEIDTDDEEKILKEKVSNSYNDMSRNELHRFLCKLCKRYLENMKKA